MAKEQNLMPDITAEQVARAIADLAAGSVSPLTDTFGAQWVGVPEWVGDAVEEPGWEPLRAALTRWHAELAAAERERRVYVLTAPIKPIDDTAPERLRAPAIDPLAYTDSPAWDEPPVRKPAPGVVDVPQPEPWHARLVRLASDVAAATKAHEDAQAEREAAERRESDAWTALRNARGALHDATKVSAILAAQSEPTRPEPRYKAGDWVRVVTGPLSSGRTDAIRVAGVTAAGYIIADGATWAAEHLTPAIDPALHETARKTVAWLRGGARGTGPADFTTLPGWSDWNSGSRWDAAEHWAAQLERLLVDAP